MALPNNAGKLTSLVDIRNYILAGDARFTLVSNKSNDRKTFRVRASENPGKPVTAWYVDLLVGSDNARDYKYLGFLYTYNARDYKYLGFLYTKTAGPEQVRGLDFRQNKERWGNESFETFSWLVRQLNEAQHTAEDDVLERDDLSRRFNQLAEVYHLGTCGKCGRDLTTPESVARGLGPVCAGES